MVTNNELKHLRQLKQKKYREQCREFMVEGTKLVQEVLHSSWQVKAVYATDNYMKNNDLLCDVRSVSKTQSEQLSSFATDAEVYACVAMPLEPAYDNSLKRILVLDAVRDAGNMGTIIRTADWFNIQGIVCSPDSVELYNPKTLQSTMGSFTRVQVWYKNVEQFIREHNGYTYYGTFMNGQPIQQCEFSECTAIILGSESHGISAGVEAMVQHKVSIPLVGASHRYAMPESLNVAMSAAICCYELTR